MLDWLPFRQILGSTKVIHGGHCVWDLKGLPIICLDGSYNSNTMKIWNVTFSYRTLPRDLLLKQSRSPRGLDLNPAPAHSYRQARVACRPSHPRVISFHAFRAADFPLADSPA